MFQDSFETFSSLVLNFPDNARAPESYYKLGLILIELEDENSAINNFNGVKLSDSSAAILSMKN